MYVEGKLTQILDPETGEGQRGPWKKQQFIIETQGEYPKKICFMVWNDKVDLGQFPINSLVRVSLNLESREFNGRWFTDATAWKIEKVDSTASHETQQSPSTSEFTSEESIGEEDDLPF